MYCSRLILTYDLSFLARESHYSRQDNADKVYLSSDLSVASMHELYLEMYEPDVYHELKAGGTVKPMTFTEIDLLLKAGGTVKPMTFTEIDLFY